MKGEFELGRPLHFDDIKEFHCVYRLFLFDIFKVKMEFKKGELEASFKAGQAVTKDLLQDTLPKLREALERSGITIASMNVGGDRQERSGDSLSQQHSPASARRQPDAKEGDGVELEKVVTHRSHDGSLDVLV